ncbi:MAG: Na+/H+ antiporter subunit D, partial [Actinobacteria bacterium]|nr:Na+/H+ antiporter subunit D [Actinomycetota bacterium]
IWVGAFWGDVEPATSIGVGILRRHALMSTATALVVALSLAIAVGAGPLYDFASKAAEQVLDIAGYVSAVKS